MGVITSVPENATGDPEWPQHSVVTNLGSWMSLYPPPTHDEGIPPEEEDAIYRQALEDAQNDSGSEDASGTGQTAWYFDTEFGLCATTWFDHLDYMAPSTSWPKTYADLFDKPHKDDAERFKLYLFLWKNGADPEAIGRWLLCHGDYDKKAHDQVAALGKQAAAGKLDKYKTYMLQLDDPPPDLKRLQSIAPSDNSKKRKGS